MVIFHIVISPACEIADTRYYRAWVGGGKRETLCTCHMLFHNYLVILNSACVREREPGSTNNRNNILSNILKTNMLNIKIFKTASSYIRIQQSYIAIRTARPTVTSLPHRRGSYQSKNQSR